MQLEEMRLKVTTLSNRLSTLHHYLDQLTPQECRQFPEMVKHLQSALEELCAADEELQAQNHELLQTQQVLDEERDRFQELFNEAPFGYVLTDTQGIIVKANRAIHDMSQIPHQFLPGKRLINLLPEAQRHIHLLLCHFCDATTRLTPAEFQTTLLRRDTTKMPVRVIARPLVRQPFGVTMAAWTIIENLASTSVPQGLPESPSHP